MSNLIWVQTVRSSDDIPKKNFTKKQIQRKNSADNKKHANYPAVCTALESVAWWWP